METTHIILLFGSCAISFGLGRTILHFKNKRRKNQALAQSAQALRDRPEEAESKNKSKRRRQLQQRQSKGGAH